MLAFQPSRLEHVAKESRAVRAILIWTFGMFASGIFGAIVGDLATHLADKLSDAPGGVFGLLGGVCAFACVRLWMGDSRKT